MNGTTVQVLAASMFAPGLSGPVARFAVPSSISGTNARGDLLPPRMRRGTSALTRLFVEVTAAVAPTRPLDGLRFVFGSAWGEANTAVALLEMRHNGDGQLSPARFAQSVHNTATGLLSIATGNREPSTAIAAGADTVAMCLLEAIGWLNESDVPVLVAVADECPPASLAPGFQHAPFAAAFLLARTARAGESLGSCRFVRSALGAASHSLPPDLVRCPAARALPLLEALARRTAGTVQLGDRPATYGVDLTFAESQ